MPQSTDESSPLSPKITVEEYFQSITEPDGKRFHNLKYIEKVADDIGRRTFDYNRSGGSTSYIIATEFMISDLFKLVKKRTVGTRTVGTYIFCHPKYSLHTLYEKLSNYL